MKLLIPLILFAVISNNAHAHPGSNTLICKSAKNSGSQQNLAITVARANGKGWINPTIALDVNEKNFELTTPDENNNYGETFHNSPLKVITVTVDVPYEETSNNGQFSIIAIPSTVKAYDKENKPMKKWTLKAEKEGCNDSNGKATFQGYIRGNLSVENKDIQIDTQILDCTLEYGSGMAC